MYTINSTTDLVLFCRYKNCKVLGMKSIILMLFFLLLGSCKENEIVSIDSIALDRNTLNLVEGETATLVATISPCDAIYDINWSSSNLEVATVKNGVVTAVKEGSAIIKARVGDKLSVCNVTVQKQTIPVTSISFDKDTIEVRVGKNIDLSLIVIPSNATNKEILLTSSNENVVEIIDGEIKAKEIGTSIVSALCGDLLANCVINVISAIDSVNFISDYKRLKVNETFKPDIRIFPNDMADYEVLYVSSDNNVVSILEDGRIMAASPGEAIVTVEVAGRKDQLKIVVFEKDIIYCSTMEYSPYISKIWRNIDNIQLMDNFTIEAMNIDSRINKIIGEKEGRTVNSLMIIDGIEYKFQDVDNSKFNCIVACEFVDEDCYSILNYSDDRPNGGYGVWKNLDKIFDFSEKGLLSDNSTLIIRGMKVINGDVYSCGSIREPINDNSEKRIDYPTVWKNGKIYKQFDPNKYDVELFSCIHNLVEVNKELYFLMEEWYPNSIGNYTKSKISIWDESGRLYALTDETSSSTGNFYVFDNQIYNAVFSYNPTTMSHKLAIYKERSLLFEIDDVTSYAIDYLDGDIYSLIVKEEKWAGEFYSSAFIYRNDVEVSVLINETDKVLNAMFIEAYKGK